MYLLNVNEHLSVKVTCTCINQNSALPSHLSLERWEILLGREKKKDIDKGKFYCVVLKIYPYLPQRWQLESPMGGRVSKDEATVNTSFQMDEDLVGWVGWQV